VVRRPPVWTAVDVACRDLADALEAHPAGVDDALRRLRGAPIARVAHAAGWTVEEARRRMALL